MVSWFCAVFWTIYAQEKPNRGERDSGRDLSLKLKQSTPQQKMKIKQLLKYQSLALVTGLAVFAVLWAMPGIVHGQVQGGDLFSTVNLGGTCDVNGGSSVFQYTPQYVPPYGTPGVFASNLNAPRGLAFDSNGNLFVTNNSVDCDAGTVQGTIFKITGGVMSTFATGFAPGVFVEGVATDSNGNVFVEAFFVGLGASLFSDPNPPTTIYKITSDGTIRPFASTGGQGFGLVFDNLGNLYVATADDTGAGEILKFSPDYDPQLGTGTMTTFVGPENFPNTGPGPIGLTFDASGNLFVSTTNSDGTNGDIRKFDSNGTEITPRFATGLTSSPRGLAFDSAGNLFLAEPGIGGTSPPVLGDILEFMPSGTKTVFASQNFGTRGNRGPEFLAFTTGAVTPPTTAVTLTLPDATAPLTATITSIDQNSLPPPPSNFVELSGINLAFDISTTVTPTPPIIIAFTVPSSLDVSQLHALHYECDTQNNCNWEDRTIYPGDPNYPSNPAPNTIYASVSSLSPFLIAKSLSPSLGAASNYTLFALTGPNSGGKQTANFSSGTDYGDVAVAQGATLKLQAPSTINGNLYVDFGGSVSGTGKVNGTRFTNQNLSTAQSDALNASALAAALAPNVTFTNVTTSRTVNGVSGVNVVNVTGSINLNNASLTLNGPSDAYFVVNVAGSITLGGSGGIVISGGMPASHLLINMRGNGSTLLNTHIGNVIQGTLLGPNAGGTLEGTAGGVILGRNFSLMTVTLRHP